MEEALLEDIKGQILFQFPLATYTTDENGLITYYNDEAAHLWGRSPRLNDPTELPFCGSFKLYSSDGTALPHDKCPMAEALKFKKELKAREICIEKPDGSRVPALENISPLFADNGRFVGAINVIYDISQKKQSEESAWRLAAIIKSSNDPIISKNLDGIITSWNKAAEKMFGYKEQEVIGKNIKIIIPEFKYDEEQLILDNIRHGQKVESLESIRITKDGRKIPVFLMISPIVNSSGKIIGASKILRDISFQVKAQQRLKVYNEKLKQLNIYKDGFIGMASHELKTPLTVIQASLQIIKKKLQGGNEIDGFVQKMLIQTSKLNTILSNLLDISKIQTGKLDLNFTTCNFREIIDESIENILMVRASHIIEKQYNYLNINILVDRIRIEQVIINLIDNAIKYSPKGSKIIVKSYLEGQGLIVCIKDLGAGISPIQLRKVFNLFFRAKETIPRPGLGVGLYLSKQIIDYHKGQLWVESEVDKGSSFYFRLPLIAKLRGKKNKIIIDIDLFYRILPLENCIKSSLTFFFEILF